MTAPAEELAVLTAAERIIDEAAAREARLTDLDLALAKARIGAPLTYAHRRTLVEHYARRVVRDVPLTDDEKVTFMRCVDPHAPFVPAIHDLYDALRLDEDFDLDPDGTAERLEVPASFAAGVVAGRLWSAVNRIVRRDA